MNFLWLLLIPYTGLAYGIHGGEFVTGINRQVRNFLCAWPFALVAFLVAAHYAPVLQSGLISAFFGVAAFIGTDIGFDNWSLWLKGLITFPPLGAGLLPLAYWIGYRAPSTNVLAEYLSGLFYGAALAVIAMVLA